MLTKIQGEDKDQEGKYLEEPGHGGSSAVAVSVMISVDVTVTAADAVIVTVAVSVAGGVNRTVPRTCTENMYLFHRLKVLDGMRNE